MYFFLKVRDLWYKDRHMRYILSLGSNIGDRENFLKKGSHFLSTLGNIVIESSMYETSPEGMPSGTRNFINTVIVIETKISPMELLKNIKELEKREGRNTLNSHMKPRQIDIDILFAGDTILNTPELTIPHPEIKSRKFVLVPLAEILPEFIDPVSGKKVKELLDKLTTGEEIKIVKTDSNYKS